MVCVLASSGVDRGFESRWDQTKNNNIWFVVYSISTEHAALSSKRKEWLTQNQENVYEWSEMSYSGPLCQCASTKQLNYGCWCWSHRDSNPRSTPLEASTQTITPPMNPRSTPVEASTQTIRPPMNPPIYPTGGEHTNHYTTDVIPED
jgi:hypothetical protein